MTVIPPQFHHCDCEMCEWLNFGTFFKFPCIVRICAWFFMHCRNHHSDNYTNHVIMLNSCLLNSFFRKTTKKTLTSAVLALVRRMSLVTGGIPSSRPLDWVWGGWGVCVLWGGGGGDLAGSIIDIVISIFLNIEEQLQSYSKQHKIINICYSFNNEWNCQFQVFNIPSNL